MAAAALAAWFSHRGWPWHVWLLAAVLAVAPDFDVVGFRFGIEYGDMLGHRGLTHSLPFAAAVSTIVVLTFYRRSMHGVSPARVGLFLFLAMASHGFLDAFTNGGRGIAFFAPFSAERFFFPFRPLEVSPLSISRFLTGRGAAILANEFVWVWLPAVGLGGLGLWIRRHRSAETH